MKRGLRIVQLGLYRKFNCIDIFMNAERETGYTKEEYYQISVKKGLPNRCPILGKCCRAVETRYEMYFRLGGADITFEKFLDSEGQKWDPKHMIKSIEQVSWRYAHDVLTSVENVCPEVTLFEDKYLPFHFRQSAFGAGTWYKDTRRTVMEPKHYSECAEFSEYSFHVKGPKTKRIEVSHLSAQIPEKVLEDYLVDRLDQLEPGLKFIERQKTIGKWKADIYASDNTGANVLIGLKTKILSGVEADNLCGQVSRYYNLLKSKMNDLRMFIVIPREKKDIIVHLYNGLKPLIKISKINLYEFDYNLYGKEFTFSKINFNLGLD